MRFLLLCSILLYSYCIAAPIMAKTYAVGPARAHPSLKPLLPQLKPGDVVEIDPGVYRQVMKIDTDGAPGQPIIIRGVGDERPVFDAENLTVSGAGAIPRAIFQIEGAYIVIENLEFKNARNGNNGAGIRLNSSTNAVIRNCSIHHCDMGIQGGDAETALIEKCDIAFNGSIEHNGYSHNFYMMGNRVVVRHCYIHDSLYGQNYKSRAHYNELWFNWIENSNEGEVGPVDGAGQTDRPDSHTLMVGNVIISKPNRTGNSAKYVLMGSESGGSHNGTLFMFYNILLAGSPKVKFIQLDDPKTNAQIHYNVFWGSDQILVNHKNSKIVAGGHNWLPGGAQIPAGFMDSYSGGDPGFVNQEENDFRLTPDSPLFDPPATVIEYIDGDGVGQSAEIDQDYLLSVRQFQNILAKVSDYRLHE
ncbi:MAG: right-handed parallel beta-helix repeat-containing protein [Candidatus Omnitrophica bacterium]|nr:right-handed parallel beta-helix repeat-containing protein [Candidatus Omnitrophota bacterium]